jgi:hypothetical protein
MRVSSDAESAMVRLVLDQRAQTLAELDEAYERLTAAAAEIRRLQQLIAKKGLKAA